MATPTNHLHPDGANLALEQQVVRLQALLEASRRIHSTIELRSILNEASRIALLELELEGVCFIKGSASITVRAGKAFDEEGGEYPRFPVLARSGELITELVVAPQRGLDLTLYEADFLEGLSLQTALAAENALNHKRHLEYARIEQDLEAARLIQESLLPQAMPTVPGYSLAAHSTACYQVGGDYLDVIVEPSGTLLMTVADVAGKGLASAMICTAFRSAFRALAMQALSLEVLAERLSQQHWAEGVEARRRYVTAIFARLDPEKGSLTFVNAGHNPALLLQGDSRVTRWIKASGTPLGLISAATYTPETFDFPSGSRLLLYTDGITEAFCGEEEFGCDRLEHLVGNCQQATSEGMLSVIWRRLKEFTDETPQSDDMTAIALKAVARSASLVAEPSRFDE